MAKNEFLPFGTAEGANVLSNQEYEALAARHNGFTSGVAKSKELNKVWRQASLIASAVAQFIVDTDQKDLLDTGDFSDIKARLSAAINLIISNGDYVTNPYLKLELLKKIDKADITQQLGNDTSKVASQNLLTTELGKKASVADANSKLAKDQNGADIPDKDTFIKNLGLPEKFQPKGNYQAAGNYADGVTYTKGADGSAQIKAPSGNAALELSFNGWLNVLNKDGEATLSFSPVGIMHVGTIPVERLSGYIRGIGDGQDWKVVTDQRKGGVTYKNPFDRAITVSVTVLVSAPNTAPVYMRSNDKAICSVSTSTDPFIRQVMTVPIGPRASYGLFSLKEVQIEHWAEMTE